MLKIIGMFLIIGASASAGFYIPRLEKNKIEFLTEFKKSFYLLKNEISYALNTLSSSFLNICERSSNGFVRQFFNELHNNLDSRNGENLRSIWRMNVGNLVSSGIISESETGSVKSFGDCLGYLDKELQMKNIDLLIESLDEVILKHKEKYDRISKLYSRMGILVGITLAVVMM